ncbi:MAG: hypothetical protein IJ846_07300 [Alphaproteobacteria bacterium]|nr:hypothetical protein [Alphaproteobacteria bacterium]
MNAQTPVTDPVRQEFMDMYEETLIDLMEKSDESDLSEEDERALRVNAMVDTALHVRKDLDPLLANKLKSLENLKDYKQILLTEFRILGFVSKTSAARIFAEYLLLSLLDEFEIEDRIDFDVFGNELNEAFNQMTDDYKDLRRVFPWGRLLD